MAKNPKKKPEWWLEQEARSKRFRELLEKRLAEDERFRAEREAQEEKT